MQIQVELSKMQYLLTGNRYSGVNLSKTRYDFDFQPSKKVNGFSFTIVFTMIIDYMEVGDQIKYLQHGTAEIDNTLLNPNPFFLLKDITLELQDKLIDKYQTSNLFKLLELPTADKMQDEDMQNRLSRIVADYNNGMRWRLPVDVI